MKSYTRGRLGEAREGLLEIFLVRRLLGHLVVEQRLEETYH